jgi:hypothetical protein
LANLTDAEYQCGFALVSLKSGERLDVYGFCEQYGFVDLADRVEELRKDGYCILEEMGPNGCLVYWIPKEWIERAKGACQ